MLWYDNLCRLETSSNMGRHSGGAYGPFASAAERRMLVKVRSRVVQLLRISKYLHARSRAEYCTTWANNLFRSGEHLRGRDLFLELFPKKNPSCSISSKVALRMSTLPVAIFQSMGFFSVDCIDHLLSMQRSNAALACASQQHVLVKIECSSLAHSKQWLTSVMSVALPHKGEHFKLVQEPFPRKEVVFVLFHKESPAPFACQVVRKSRNMNEARGSTIMQKPM